MKANQLILKEQEKICGQFFYLMHICCRPRSWTEAQKVCQEGQGELLHTDGGVEIINLLKMKNLMNFIQPGQLIYVGLSKHLDVSTSFIDAWQYVIYRC